MARFNLNNPSAFFCHDEMIARTFSIATKNCQGGVFIIMRDDIIRKYRMFVLDYIKEGDVCAEIGVYRGLFSKHILERKPSHFYAIDSWEYFPEFNNRCYGKRKGVNQDHMDNIYEQAVENIGNNPRVTMHRMKSAQAAKLLPDDHLDFIYIDGNHNFEYVMSDIISFVPKMKETGIICGDDYKFPRCKRGGAQNAIKELVKIGYVKLLKVEGNQFVLKIEDKDMNPLDALDGNYLEKVIEIIHPEVE